MAIIRAVQILFINPYHRGSHRDFFEQWSRHSKHTFRLLNLSGRNWKWRMRHGAWTLANVLRAQEDQSVPDVVFSTDMLDLALWKACAPDALRSVPHIQYFHENQLVYPDRRKRDEDLHFACTNILSGALANEAWFNSRYHLETFIEGARLLDLRLPGRELNSAISVLESHAYVRAPGVELRSLGFQERRSSEKLRVLWIGRWEWDKGNDRFVRLATAARKSMDVEFVVLGASLALDEREHLHELLGRSLVFAGFVESREAYETWLRTCDVVLSTARHEFFGLAVLEASLCGCIPLLPNGLAYPEVFSDCEEAFFYDDEGEALLRLERLFNDWREGKLLPPRGQDHWLWSVRARELDACLEAVV